MTKLNFSRAAAQAAAVLGACLLTLACPLTAQAAAGAKPVGENTPLDLSQSSTAVHSSSGGASIVRTIVGLAIVIAVIWGLSWILRQVKSGRDPQVSSSGLASVAALTLGSGRSVHLVRAGTDYVLIGAAEHGLVPLHRYTEEQAREAGLPTLPEAPARPRRSLVAGVVDSQARPDRPDADALTRGQPDRTRARTDGAPVIVLAASSGLNLDSSNAVQVLLLIGGLTLIPAVLFTVTGFSRILIVLGFIRTAVGTGNAPPNQVLVGIALFLTIFVMSPTIDAIKKDAIEPLEHHAISTTTAISRAEVPLREFMFRQTRSQDISLFVSLAHEKTPHTRAEVPTQVLIPAFIVSELKTAFQIGFLIFLPFLIIDLIVSSTLMSMGMIMLPPTFISLPFKILLFVLVDGWDLVIKALVQSFH